MNTQHEEIKAGLDILFEPGQVFEVRALGKWTYAGFFNDTNIAAREIIRTEQMNKYAGIYVTINPVNPDLFYRCSNRMMDAGKSQLTGNNDIILRKWLIIDIDPERISGISASDAEKALAFEMIPSVKGFLTSAGFPEPIIADSGNGAHLLYKLDDIPATSDLISKFLTGLAKRFDSIAPDAKCKIDTSVSNAGRISKVYGTMSRKGDDSETRPHRRSKILCAPSWMGLVTEEHITEVLYLLYPHGEPVQAEEVPADYVKVSDYLDAWGITYSSVKRSGNENVYALDDCPFSPDHSDGAYVCQNVITGAISAKCHHDRCGGGKINHWKELHARYDPGYDLSGIDISGILNQGKKTATLQPTLSKHRVISDVSEIIDHEQTGFLKLDIRLPRDNYVVKYMNYWRSRTDAYPEYHHSAVVSLLSIAANRIMVYRLSDSDTYTNIWAMNLGKSSISRKSTAVNKILLILESGTWLKSFHRFPGLFSSEGLFEEMTDEPRGFMLLDECVSLLGAINTKKYLSDVRDVLCKIYDCVGGRRKLKTSKGKVSEFKVEYPYATFLFATTHENFINSATGVDLTSGWLIRFLFYYPQYKKDTMGIREASGDEDNNLNELNNEFWQIATDIKEYSEIRCTLSPFGFDYYNKWIATAEEEMLTSGIHGSVFQRYARYALKLAALYYIGEPGAVSKFPKQDSKVRIIIPDEYLIESVRQINDYFLPVSKEVIDDVNDATSGNIQKRIVMLVKGANDRIVTRSEIIRHIQMPISQINDALDALEEGGAIERFVMRSEGAKKDTQYIKYLAR